MFYADGTINYFFIKKPRYEVLILLIVTRLLNGNITRVLYY